MILKAPRAGTVKTRLARDVGPERATTIYRALVECQAGAIPPEWNVSVHFAPANAKSEMKRWLSPRLPLAAQFVAQCKGDLGQRLAAATSAEFQRGADRVFLIGGDCPGISRNYFYEADRRLNEVDLVIGPATDGGYVLLGLTAPHTALFECIAWSTSEVFRQTLATAKRLALSVALLPTLEDIDDASALNRYCASVGSLLP